MLRFSKISRLSLEQKLPFSDLVWYKYQVRKRSKLNDLK